MSKLNYTFKEIFWEKKSLGRNSILYIIELDFKAKKVTFIQIYCMLHEVLNLKIFHPSFHQEKDEICVTVNNCRKILYPILQCVHIFYLIFNVLY